MSYGPYNSKADADRATRNGAEADAEADYTATQQRDDLNAAWDAERMRRATDGIGRGTGDAEPLEWLAVSTAYDADRVGAYMYGGWRVRGTAPGVRDASVLFRYYSRPVDRTAFGAEQQRARLASGLIFADDVTAWLQGVTAPTLASHVAAARTLFAEAHRGVRDLREGNA